MSRSKRSSQSPSQGSGHGGAFATNSNTRKPWSTNSSSSTAGPTRSNAPCACSDRVPRCCRKGEPENHLSFEPVEPGAARSSQKALHVLALPQGQLARDVGELKGDELTAHVALFGERVGEDQSRRIFPRRSVHRGEQSFGQPLRRRELEFQHLEQRVDDGRQLGLDRPPPPHRNASGSKMLA